MGEREQRYSSEDGVSIESIPKKPSRAAGAIDLTGEDFPRSSVSNQVDLTGETDAERRMMNVMSGRPSDIAESAGPMSIGIYAGNDPIVLDSDDEGDADFSSDFDEQFEDNDSRDSDRLRINAVFEDDSEEIEDSENEGSMEDSEMDSDAGSDEEIPIAAPKPAVVSNLTRYAVATDESPVIRLSDVRTRIELPTNDNDNENDNNDDQSEFGLSEAGAEGMKALYGANSTVPDQDAPDFEGGNETEEQAQAEETSSLILPTLTQEMDLPANTVFTSVGEPSTQGSLLGSFSIVRQPSPSDAAMVKSANMTKKAGICNLGDSGDYSPQALGEKSGKSAFFAAREVNKARFGSGEPGQSLNAFQASNRTIEAFLGPSNPRNGAQMPVMSHAGAGNLSGWNEPAVEQTPFATASTGFGNFEAEPSMPTFVGSGNAGKFFGGNTNRKSLRRVVSGIPTRDYCSFLDKPDESPILERTPSPLPDMTSSFSYNTSKDTMMLTSNIQHNARSAIKITDIVESSTPFFGTSSLKRKSDNISNVTDEELRNWATSNVTSDLPEASASVPVHRGEKSNDLSNVVEAPPTKRFKKLLANAGYVALGGATLFAALVATAPDLM
ncbi:hypothetical protein ONS95_003901 [Cadophora gregata]|uniref:uncharacterized protein n=1 Tax=Cadophora gregata TaxID=51156 RepID=UPI0026DD47DA|nr:uncharacterized protein ONS95_003901 [Cadophora gregata]KAK0107198.1 hypothetical protein ONS95_003901 [Cadophora gregata]